MWAWHESTISRVTSNKYVHTPQGTFELKFFFNSGISRSDGSFVASQSVKNEIENIIKAEDPKASLERPGDRPGTQGKRAVRIARRTVAKYRELLGIVPSNRRKKTLLIFVTTKEDLYADRHHLQEHGFYRCA
ncbi:MAG: hypothetical protein ACOX3E_15275 [Desulfomonilia bacterium]